MLDRPTKLFIAIATLMISLFLVMNLIKDESPVEDWLLAALLALVSAGFWIWMWLEDREPAPSSAMVVADVPTAPVSTVREWEVPAAPVAPAAEEAPALLIETPEEVKTQPVVEVEVEPEPEPEPVVEPEPEPEPVVEVEPDDLTRIEGIGPKYSAALVAAGIDTFQKLADATEAQVEEAVTGAAMLRRPASMSTWNEQAAFAAKGDWDGLSALQDTLKGGRRVD